jgi:hypothetical protein
MHVRSMPSGLRLTQRCTSLAPMSIVTNRVVRLWACRNSTACASWVPSSYAHRPPATMVTTVSPLQATLTSLVLAVSAWTAWSTPPT